MSEENKAGFLSCDQTEELLADIVTVKDMLENDLVVITNDGVIGYEKICSFFCAARANEKCDIIFATIPDENNFRRYQHIGLHSDDPTQNYMDGKPYTYTAPPLRDLSDTMAAVLKPGTYLSCFYHKDSEDDIIGMCLSVKMGSYYYQSKGLDRGAFDFQLPICSISDLLKVTGFDGETLRKIYFDNLSRIKSPLDLNVMYNGVCTQPHKLTGFLNAVSRGEEYCSFTVTDITKTDEYEERFYAVEKLDDKYRVFTMTGGFEGSFETQLFDGFTLGENELVFDNGKVRYSFPVSVKPGGIVMAGGRGAQRREPLPHRR